MRVMPSVFLPCLLVGLAARATAQGAEALAAQAEKSAIDAMFAHADALAANKQHGRALALRRSALESWSPGDERALQHMGYILVGNTWRRDASKVVVEFDEAGDPKVQKKIDQEWAKTEKALVLAFEAAATALVAEGKMDRSQQVYRRILFFRPADKAALAALASSSFDGIEGSISELALVQRGRSIRQAVEFLRTWDPPMEPLSEPHPILKAAGVPHHGLSTRHFRVYGSIAPEKLRLAAANAERALLLSRLLFVNALGERFEPRKIYNIAWFDDRASYKAALEACKAQFTPDRLRFLQDDCDTSFVQDGKSYLRLYTFPRAAGDDYLPDATARGVVQDASGIEPEGLFEGVGHAAVGILFDRTLCFTNEPPTGTVSKWKPKQLLPEIQAWRAIASESAWARNDTPTVRIVVAQASRFTNEERVKAWAICDFLVRTNPGALLELSASQQRGNRDPDALAAAYMQRTQRPIDSIDEQWRAYWGSGERLRKAMLQAPRGDKESVEAARGLAHSIYRVRAAAGLAPGGFVVADSPETGSAHDYYLAREQYEAQLKAAQKPQKPQKPPKQPKAGAKPAPAAPPPQPVEPEKPAAIGASVAVHEGGDADAAVAAWMADPALRDCLLDPSRAMFRLSKGKHAFVLELFHPVEPVQKGSPFGYPIEDQRVVVDRAAAAAWPISLHFFRDVDESLLRQVECKVRCNGTEVAGSLRLAQGQKPLSARGCVAFVADAQLPAGDYEVDWGIPPALLVGKGARPPRMRFVVQ